MKIFHHLKQKIVKLTIRKEILIALLCTALIPTSIVGIYGGLQINKFLNNKFYSYNQEIIRQTGQTLEYLVENIKNAQKQLIVHSISSPIFYKYDELSKSNIIKEIKNTNIYLDSIRQTYPFIKSIYLIDNNQRVYSNLIEFDKTELLNKNWIQNLLKTPYGNLIIPLHNSSYDNSNFIENEKNTISFLRKISRLGNIKQGSIILLDIDESTINKFITDFPLQDGCYIKLEDSNGKIIADYVKNSEKTKLTKYTEFKYKLNNIDWTIEVQVPNTNLYSLNWMTIWIFVILFLSVLIFSVFLSFIFSKRITIPLYKVIKQMENLGEGNSGSKIPDVSNRDLHLLVKGINNMDDQLKVLVKNIKLKEKEKTQAELNALQAQINPHFLYNTLDVIRGMSIVNNNFDVVDITASLAKIFRYSIGANEIVSIKDEIKNAKHYLNIQNQRFKDRFDNFINIDDSILECLTIKLIIQPIIENSFKYGIELIRKKGFIKIDGSLKGEFVCIVIENSGPIVDNNRIEEINYQLENSIEKKHFSKGGMGLYNINCRLKLHFNKKAGIQLVKKEEGGIKVIITFPKTMKREDLNGI